MEWLTALGVIAIGIILAIALVKFTSGLHTHLTGRANAEQAKQLTELVKMETDREQLRITNVEKFERICKAQTELGTVEVKKSEKELDTLRFLVINKDTIKGLKKDNGWIEDAYSGDDP